ncbi:unnamed protein product [Prunus armeniaca]|uniref:Uncharacterized protein n=1 Tax=Prunus armeniaca TaxID=36596 RepID=A0A6J5X6Z2_PRUAR|nr:unnamed protein product [Prunus armeniaca]
MVSSKVIGKGLPSKDVTMCHVKKMLFCLPAPAVKNGGVRRVFWSLKVNPAFQKKNKNEK